MENYRTECTRLSKLDAAQYLTTSGHSWDAMLKHTGSEIEAFNVNQYDMYLFLERSIRGGMCQISHRKSTADKNKFILYLDATNLYGWAMTQKLPCSNYEFVNLTINDILNHITKPWNSYDYGYFIECDLEYPK